MAQNNQNQQNSIMDTAVSIDPVAVIYNIENDVVENFVYNYLNDIKQIDGVAAVRLNVVRDGNRNPQLSLYAFLDNRSKDVFSNMKNVPEHLRRKMDMGGFRATDKLNKALSPIVRETKIFTDPRNKVVYIKLDVFKVFGLMLAADRRAHYLTVSEVMKLKKQRSITTVIKSNKFIDKNDDDSFDRYSNIVQHHER
jgi:transcriptional regulator of aromatic amino acid metabolism